MFFCAYFAAVAFSLPIASLLTLAGGAIFGMASCNPCSNSINSRCRTGVFAARNLFSDILQRRAGPFLGKLEDGFSQNAFFYLLALRLVPTVPFWVLNIVPALTRMGMAQFLTATFIGIIPGSFVYVWVGRGFDQALTTGQTPGSGILSSSTVLLPLGALAALSLTPVFLRLRQTSVKKRQ